MDPLVSIITPCFNSEDYIARYLDSILAQTYDYIQVIIVNDGSTDRTEEIVFNYKERLLKKGCVFTYIKQSNAGLGAAINHGLKEVRGDYFAWCDSDNYYSIDYVEEKVRFFLANPQYSIVRCDGYIVDEALPFMPISTLAKNNTEKNKEDLFENCILGKNFHFGCAMLKTEDFDKVVPEREIYQSREGQNWQLLLPMFYYFKSGYIDRPMFYFVYRNNSISNIASRRGIAAIIRQYDEYQKIMNTTIKNIKMQEKERHHYLHMIAVKYHRKKLLLASAFQEKDIAKEHYQWLQENHCKLTWKEKIRYCCGQNDILFFVLKVLRGLKRAACASFSKLCKKTANFKAN